MKLLYSLALLSLLFIFSCKKEEDEGLGTTYGAYYFSGHVTDSLTGSPIVGIPVVKENSYTGKIDIIDTTTSMGYYEYNYNWSSRRIHQPPSSFYLRIADGQLHSSTPHYIDVSTLENGDQVVVNILANP